MNYNVIHMKGEDYHTLCHCGTGFSSKTTDPAEVTCKNCLYALNEKAPNDKMEKWGTKNKVFRKGLKRTKKVTNYP